MMFKLVELNKIENGWELRFSKNGECADMSIWVNDVILNFDNGEFVEMRDVYDNNNP